MGTVASLTIIAVVVGVLWSHQSCGTALAGRTFLPPYPTSVVADATCGVPGRGAKSAFRRFDIGRVGTSIGGATRRREVQALAIEPGNSPLHSILKAGSKLCLEGEEW